MKHFSNEFSNDGEVPRQWPSLKEEQIKALFVIHAIFRNKRRASTSRSSTISPISSSHSRKDPPPSTSATNTKAKFPNRATTTASLFSASPRKETCGRSWKKKWANSSNRPSAKTYSLPYAEINLFCLYSHLGTGSLGSCCHRRRPALVFFASHRAPPHPHSAGHRAGLLLRRKDADREAAVDRPQRN